MSVEQVMLFRKKFREEITPKYYSGVLHLGFNAIVLFSLMIGFYFQVSAPSWQELMVFPATLVLGNLGVYFIHRILLHKNFPLIGEYTYKVHSKWHHQFYTDEVVIYESSRDFYILFFPPAVIAGFALGYIPAFYFGLKAFVPANALYIFLGTSTLYFILYEVFHYVSHLPEDHWVLNFKPFRFMRAHHVDHHNTRIMHTHNFNIVFPLFDWVFGTIYKKDQP
jgi:hypothetical protein